jgi:Ca2+-binding EF-hand superfamily protein
MRVRKVAEKVMRHQKEANCVAMMRLVAVILDSSIQEPLTPDDVAIVEKCLQEDADAIQKGSNPEYMAAHVGSFLRDKAGELVMVRMNSLFDGIDKDGSGALSLEEIYTIFAEIGLDNPEEINECLEPMLRNIDLSRKNGLEAKGDKEGLESKGASTLGLCAPRKSAPPEAKPQADSQVAPVELSKPVFLTWFLHLERAARNMTAEHVAEVWFQLIDDDNSGRLSVLELQEVLESCGKAFSADDVTALILELDTNGDGEFDKDEFTTWVQRHVIQK